MLTVDRPRVPSLETKKFSDLFKKVELYNDRNKQTFDINGLNVGSYCVRADKDSLTLTPTQLTLETLAANMLTIDNDEIYFEVIKYHDGTSGVWARYNKIIGHHLLAIVDTKTVRLTPRRRSK